ncbi:hypothetical protein WMF30_51200 [Sorangium sp. So ce134]
MTTLAVRAESLVSDVQKLSQLKEAAHRLKEYQQRRERLQRVLAGLQPPARFVALLAERGIDIAPAAIPTSLGEVIAQATALAERYAADPAVVLGGDFPALLKTLTAAQEQLAWRARASWKDYSGPIARAVSKELLDALERIDSFRKTVQRIRSHQTVIEQLAAKDWVEQADLDRFSSLVEQRTMAWDELEAGGAIPDEIVEFLKQCNKGGARLDTVKSETVEWLRNRGIVACFRVVF